MIGLKYFNEFLERIPREEVAQIESVVREAAASFRTGLLIQTCGSYRRGKDTCGDCDILITHRDGVSHEHLLFPLVDKLKQSGKGVLIEFGGFVTLSSKVSFVMILCLRISTVKRSGEVRNPHFE